MNRKIIYLITALSFLLGCGNSVREGVELTGSPSFNTLEERMGGENGTVFDPNEMETALPTAQDLGLPSPLKREKPRKYTGIIKNKTKREVSVPSGNSGSTLVIPANSWVEYTSWKRRFALTAYYDGKPFYCLKISAHPKNYAFMCQQYDFIAEIVKDEPAPKVKKKKKKIPGGVQGLG